MTPDEEKFLSLDARQRQIWDDINAMEERIRNLRAEEKEIGIAKYEIIKARNGTR